MEAGPKKTALWVLIGSVALSAVLGIWAILSGNFGEFQEKVLLTTLTITGASVCGLACGALWETGRNRWLPAAGISLAIVAAGMSIVGIWYAPNGALFWRLAVSAWLLSLATGHVCLLALARLAPRFRWAGIAAHTLTYLLAALGIYEVFAERTNENVYRAIGVVAILVGAVSLIVPIFHRLSKADFNLGSSAGAGSASIWATITCPQCGNPQTNSPAAIECTQCGCVFRITLLRNAATQSTVA